MRLIYACMLILLFASAMDSAKSVNEVAGGDSTHDFVKALNAILSDPDFQALEHQEKSILLDYMYAIVLNRMKGQQTPQ